MKRLVWAIVFWSVGVAVGYGVFHKSPVENNSILWNYVFYSTVNDKLAISIKADGTTEIGPMYDRETEARKLFEMVQAWRNEGRMIDCHETGYHSDYWSQPDLGLMLVNPGPANPPPLRQTRPTLPLGRTK